MLEELARYLETHQAVREKALIQKAFSPAIEVAGEVRLGDDCAAIPNPTGRGYLLFAAEGMLESFVREDPWFAGYCAVMVNLSDVAAMGGRAIAVTDVLWTPSEMISAPIWGGMKAAANAYGVPIVGGHTTQHGGASAFLAAAVLGHAGERLITSFDAQPGDHLVMVVDMDGAYHGKKPFWNASTKASPTRLRTDLERLPCIAEQGLCCAGKDISNGGVIGTLAMLCASSQLGATVDLRQVPIPHGVPWERWLTSFPSYGYLLAVAPQHLDAVETTFASGSGSIACEVIGKFQQQREILLRWGQEERCLHFTPEIRVPALP